ncbi:hypothetical protein HU200_064356 [Digitaria exilis]|uniref:Protein SDA1 n=1 Tax=Digitaria exilis TaxID=1010633 RepID=A0A835A225_9POAL|nr:hypothetical protein HU200_064356 [Digitaria exilis]
MPRKHAPAFTPDAASASSVAGQPHNLPVLQAKMKRDPEGYEEELRQLHRHFESSVFLFQQQAALATTSSSAGGGEVAKELGDLALFLAHVAPFYPDDLADLPDQIGAEEESRAKRAFTILCDLHRRRVWFDERTTNAICEACFHPSSRQITRVQLLVRKKKQAKLQRVIRSMKRQQRKSVEESGSSYYSPLTYLKDAQGFAESFFLGCRNAMNALRLSSFFSIVT